MAIKSSQRELLTVGACLVVAVTAWVAAQSVPTYRDASASVDARVADLLARMTLEEKVAQLQGIWNRKREIQDAQGRFDPARAQAVIGHGIGEVSRTTDAIASRPDAVCQCRAEMADRADTARNPGDVS
jgi:beta-glucosidase